MSDVQWQRSVLTLLRTITVLMGLLIVGLTVLVLYLNFDEGRTTEVGSAPDSYRFVQGSDHAAFFNTADRLSFTGVLNLKQAYVNRYLSAYSSASASQRIALDANVAARLAYLQTRYLELQIQLDEQRQKADVTFLNRLFKSNAAISEQLREQRQLNQELLSRTKELLRRTPTPPPTTPPAPPPTPQNQTP